MPRPAAVLERKVLDLRKKGTVPKVSIPRWWIRDCERVRLEVYMDKLVIKKESNREVG